MSVPEAVDAQYELTRAVDERQSFGRVSRYHKIINN
jgi:hypothetical protein